jgi:uncharacterized membrane protein
MRLRKKDLISPRNQICSFMLESEMAPGEIMKAKRVPAIAFALALIGYMAFLACTISLLPPRMATHFGADGQPNGWTGRSTAVLFQGVIGLVLPLIVMAAFYTIKFVPTRCINVPHRDFWFASERRDDTCSNLSRSGLWLATLLVGFAAAVWYQVIESNTRSLPRLSPSEFWGTLAIFGAAMVYWALTFFRHFTKAA